MERKRSLQQAAENGSKTCSNTSASRSMNRLPSEDRERVFFLTYAPWIDHELPPINRLEIGTEMNSGMPVKRFDWEVGEGRRRGQKFSCIRSKNSRTSRYA